MEHIIKVLANEFVTHDVHRIIAKKPDNYHFTPGQATELSVNKPSWENEKRPFTFTSLNSWEVLEFTIKSYPKHKGVTEQIGKLRPGDYIIVRDIWGTINYKGPGVFIAGGAGITPFIAILRDLKEKGEIEGNTLIFSNREWKDIILEREFKDMLGDDCRFILSREKRPGYDHGHIDSEYLKENVKDFNQHFYICGPPKFVVEIKKLLDSLGANPDSVVIEL